MCRWLSVLLVLLPALAAAEPVRVFVSVLPQKTFVERVGGDRVQVQVMIQPGASPHTYDPTPRQVAALAEADLYVAVGVSFEDAWMGRIRATNARMRVLDSAQGLHLRHLEAHEHEETAQAGHADAHGDHVERSAADPHLWTSPPLVKQMTERIRDALTELDPDGGPTFTVNQASFATELDALDAEIRTRLAGLASRRFMVFHPAWGYFADTYDLTQVPIEHEGKEPGPKALAALIDQARRQQVQAIFVQPQFPRKAAAQVAAAIGGRVDVLDPLAPDYVANLRRVADVLATSARP
jgi:zinc transport system substrate-binding protein